MWVRRTTVVMFRRVTVSGRTCCHFPYTSNYELHIRLSWWEFTFFWPYVSRICFWKLYSNTTAV